MIGPDARVRSGPWQAHVYTPESPAIRRESVKSQYAPVSPPSRNDLRHFWLPTGVYRPNLTIGGPRIMLKRHTLEKAAMRHVAVYVRVSKRNGQDFRSQLPDLERWAAAQDQPVRWYKDRFTGKTMDRPGWNRLQAAIDAAEVSAVVVWRLDRLGRTAKGLTALFHDLHEKKINVISLKDGLDLGTAAGRLMANVLASVCGIRDRSAGRAGF